MRTVIVTRPENDNWIFCVNETTRETQYMSIAQVAECCCDKVLEALSKGQNYEWECNTDCPHINS